MKLSLGADARVVVTRRSCSSRVPAERNSGGNDALIVLHTAAQFMENGKLFFKQMANLPIHKQALNQIKHSSQGCRCVSPDHFGRHQFNCSSIFVKAVPKCPPCPLVYLPIFSLFLSSCLSGIWIIIRWMVSFPDSQCHSFKIVNMIEAA